MKNKLGEVTGQPLFSMDGITWYSSEAMAISVFQKTASRHTTERLHELLLESKSPVETELIEKLLENGVDQSSPKEGW